MLQHTYDTPTRLAAGNGELIETTLQLVEITREVSDKTVAQKLQNQITKYLKVTVNNNDALLKLIEAAKDLAHAELD